MFLENHQSPKSRASKIIVLLISLLFSLTAIFAPVKGKTYDELEKEIEEKKQELDTLENQLNEAENAVDYFKSQQGTASNQLEKIENEIKQIEAEVKVNTAELKKYKNEINLLELEMEQNEMLMNDRLVDLYIYNKQGVVDVLLENGQMDGFWKDYKYRETLLDNDLEGLNKLGDELDELSSKKESFEKAVSLLEEENKKLAERKTELSGQISYYESMASYNTSKQSGIRAQMGVVNQEIEGLSEEQQRIIDEEIGIIIDANGGTKPLVSGEYYFYGRGRTLYQGHGLGFSQYGAYGGGQKGMSGKEIAKFYYAGSSIGSASGSIEVIGYGTMNIETYVSGLGEIPDKACGTKSQVNSRPDKYALDNPNTIWDCWPENAIEAQVIVARSYALAYGGPICTTAQCQVYKGGNGKKWAADETKGKVIKSGGSIIKAFYSSDNNNGWGTATHRNPVWCWDFHGNCGSGHSWLQAVNDSSFAAKGPYTDWIWRTNSYTLAELESMLKWFGNAGYSHSQDVKNLQSNIGKLKNIKVHTDASGRSAKIEMIGSKGSENINGEIFKEIFNLWVGNVKPSGEVDPLFSITLHFVKVP